VSLRKRIRVAVLSAIILTLASSVSAQDRGNFQYRIDRWTTDNGLPQNSVTSLTQAPDGYIWFTTNDGLVRFDGVRFAVFNKSNTPEITTNRLLGAFTDKHGRVWVQSEDGGILYYEKGVFHLAMKPSEAPPGRCSLLFDDQLGSVFFCANHTNYRFTDGKFVPFTIAGLPAESQILLSDREGGLWFANGQKLHRVIDGKIRSYELSGSGPGRVYRTAYEDRQGGIWLGYFDLETQSLIRLKNDRIQSFHLPGPVSHFAEDQAGNLWISIHNKGIYRIDQKRVAADNPIADSLELVSAIGGLSDLTIGAFWPDHEGAMWVGTDQGLVRFLPQTIRVFSKQSGLPDDNVYPIYQDHSGRIWAGAWANSLLKYENGNFSTIPRKQGPGAYITSLFEDGSGRLWVGNVLQLFYLDHGQLVDFSKQVGFSQTVEFSVISQDRDGNLWFGTSRGLARYSGKQSTLFTKNDGLPDDYVVAFLQARDGRIWVGTRGGLAVMDNGRIRAFTEADGLASNYIRSLYEDSGGVLWIGSYDGGLTRLKDGKFTRFTMRDGLSSNGVFCILEDDRGWFWMNSNQGIFRVSKRELNDFADGKTKFLTSIAYNKEDGLLNIEGNGGRQPAGIKARDGSLWFPTAEGIAVIDPANVAMDKFPPPVLIEDVTVNRNKVENKVLQAAVGSQSEITLAPGQGNLEINYTGISFINAAKVRFRYRLEELERDWNEVGTRRTAYYSYLPPGDYTFHVIAANRDGIWNTEGARIKIRVLAPFYRANWFILLCALTMVGLFSLAYGWRMRLMTDRLDLQYRERLSERTRIARELHDTLLQSFQGLMLRFQTVHDLLPERPLDAKQALEGALDRADQAVAEGRDAVQDLRSSGEVKTDLSEDLTTQGKQLAAMYGLDGAMSFRVVVEGAPKTLSLVIRDQIYRIVREGLRNAFVHAQASHIEAEIAYSEKSLRVRIRDDGKGIDSEVLNQGERAGHWGLPGMRERAKLMGAQLEVWSETGAGTEIDLNIPGFIAYESSAGHTRYRLFQRRKQRTSDHPS
jgi:ligand-binding sensor domain-containing protein/signal transduction histidine kinase